ncbi:MULTISPECIES: GAF domain-containing protein [Actinoplanes]|uniref:GAF domain-containing protein n=1 Tax=Actinoplanes TaxID=1865 RepID=UPI0005F2E44D|nr:MULTISPECIES: GAF domain-containing protein [Actinoplanes]GLX99855.1 hypothetical protein Acsp01_02350 [Actinoplanes sp. NBRC 101535]
MMTAQQISNSTIDDSLTDPDRLMAVAEILDADRLSAADLEQFTLGLTKVTGSKIAAVNLVLGDEVLVTGSHGMDGWLLETSTYETDRTPCSTVVRTGRTLLIPDLLQETLYSQCPLASNGGIRSYVGAPLLTIRRYVVGTVCLLDREPNVFTEAHRTVLEHLARYAATQLRIGD